MRKQTKRKIWGKPNHLKFLPQEMPDNILNERRLVEASALDAFTSGIATEDHAAWLHVMALTAYTMASKGIGPEVLPIAILAQTRLFEAKERYNKTGKWGLTGPAINTMRELMEYHDLQRTSVSRAEYAATLANLFVSQIQKEMK